MISNRGINPSRFSGITRKFNFVYRLGKSLIINILIKLIEHLESNLAFAIAILKDKLEASAALCILLGFLQIVRAAIAINRSHHRDLFIQIRLGFVQWLVLALELQLGADILATTGSPSFADLGKLGAIAAIRTFLNYFLHQELKAQFKRKEQSLSKLAGEHRSPQRADPALS